MLYVYLGTDRKKAREEMNTEVARSLKNGARLVRITDIQSADDVRSALLGGGLFQEARVVVFDGLFANEESGAIIFAALEAMAKDKEAFFIYEEKIDADNKRSLKEYAEKFEQFDVPKTKEDSGIFSLARALERADKKALWIGLEKEIAGGKAPEAIHGVLFWGAKQALLSARAGSAEATRASTFVSQLAELPHQARRSNMPLEYALLRFALSVA